MVTEDGTANEHNKMNCEVTKEKLAALAIIGVVFMAPRAFAGGEGHSGRHASAGARRHRHHGEAYACPRDYYWHHRFLDTTWGYPWYTGYEDYGYADYGYSYPNPHYAHP